MLSKSKLLATRAANLDEAGAPAGVPLGSWFRSGAGLKIFVNGFGP